MIVIKDVGGATGMGNMMKKYILNIESEYEKEPDGIRNN